MIDVLSEKIRISELAIRGTLSARVSSPISIEDIITDIRSERDNLIKNNESKISKTAPMMDDIPFDVPAGWQWVALGDLCVLLSRGKSPKYSEKKKYPVFAQKCNQPNGLALDKALFLDESTLEKWPEYFRLCDEDIVINSTGTGTVGRVGYYSNQTLDAQYEFMVPDSHVTVVRVGKVIISKYVYYALRTNTIQSIMGKTYKGSTNQKEFYIDSVYSIPVPIPPPEEQKQIVSILDKVFEQLDIIDALQQQYESDCEILKGKIIDAGIRGELTEQLPEDGNADELLDRIAKEKKALIESGKIPKEKKLQDVSDEEFPFEIPSNWRWVRVQEVASYITDYVANGSFATLKAHTKTYKEPNYALFVRTMDLSSDFKDGCSFIDKASYDFLEKSQLFGGELILPNIGASIGKAFIMPDMKMPMSLAPNSILLKFTEPIMNEYFSFVIKSTYGGKMLNKTQGGSATAKFSKTDLRNLIVPLPPLNEIKRIVGVINKTCDVIE